MSINRIAGIMSVWQPIDTSTSHDVIQTSHPSLKLSLPSIHVDGDGDRVPVSVTHQHVLEPYFYLLLPHNISTARPRHGPIEYFAFLII